METVLLVIHIMVVLALVVVVLLQRSEGGALGMGGGGGGGGGFFSSRGTANLLTRTTAILATVFFLTSIALTFMAGRMTGGSDSLLDRVLGTDPLPGASSPLPNDGTRGTGQGILDTLRPPSDPTPAAPAPATPAAPSGPQVPSGD